MKRQTGTTKKRWPSALSLRKKGTGTSAEDFRKQFFTDELQQRVGTLLLEIKMAYYKDGVGDISLEVVKDGRNVVIKTRTENEQKAEKISAK